MPPSDERLLIYFEYSEGESGQFCAIWMSSQHGYVFTFVWNHAVNLQPYIAGTVAHTMVS